MRKEVRDIISCIIHAQAASDAGKENALRYYGETPLYEELFPTEKSRLAYIRGYGYKDDMVWEAIQKISKLHNSGIYYCVTKDYQGVADYIVYFDIKVDGVRRQVSFHSFDGALEKYVGKKSCMTRWTGKCDSRMQCRILAKEVGLMP